MSITRRNLMRNAAAALVGGALVTSHSEVLAAKPESSKDAPPTGDNKPLWSRPALAPGEPTKDYRPVITPNGAALPYRLVDGTKIFHLIAEEIEHEFTDNLKAKCWGFNGTVHGPTIEFVEGDHVRIYVTNNLPAATSIHWHAMIIPNGMDGVGGLTQPEIKPGETFRYEFTINHHGTFMYHSHHDEMIQIALGVMGMVVVHPRKQPAKPADRDYAILLSEWLIIPGTDRPVPTEMTNFNIFTMNGKAFPSTAPLLAETGELVRIRIGNLSPTDHHPIHLHGHSFKVVETDGGPIPEAGQWPEVTILVPVGSTRTIEFIADNPGDWAFHCHMTHHLMNQMGHEFPNMIGVNPGALDEKMKPLLPDYMTMGETGMAGMMSMGGPRNTASMNGPDAQFGSLTMAGMATVIKVRDKLNETSSSESYNHPEGTVSARASADELKRDGVKS